MSMHIEWDIADSCDVAVLTAAHAEETLRPEDGIAFGRHVLVLGGAGGGQLAIEGDIDHLAQLVIRVARALAAAQDLPNPTSDRAIQPEVVSTRPRAITSYPAAGEPATDTDESSGAGDPRDISELDEADGYPEPPASDSDDGHGQDDTSGE